MDKIIKSILNKLNNEGYEAYIVGGYVRDYLLGIKSMDIDICTNALPKNIHKIFLDNSSSNSYGGFNLKLNGYNIDITTFRRELLYDKRKPVEIEYINSLKEDILRRDFTINTICMDKDEKIIDLLDGINDLNNRVIKMHGDIKKKLVEDPLRILRAIRFATILNFDIDDELLKEISLNHELVKTLSKERIKNEFNKILLSKNFMKGLELLKITKVLEILEISYKDISYVNDICGMWAQIDTKVNYSFTKLENTNIINIKRIIEDGNITSKELFKYGLYNSLVAAEILNISKNDILRMHKNLQIKDANDLDISGEEIMKLLNIGPSRKLKIVKEELINLILDGKLQNNKTDIMKYLKVKE